MSPAPAARSASASNISASSEASYRNIAHQWGRNQETRVGLAILNAAASLSGNRRGYGFRRPGMTRGSAANLSPSLQAGLSCPHSARPRGLSRGIVRPGGAAVFVVRAVAGPSHGGAARRPGRTGRPGVCAGLSTDERPPREPRRGASGCRRSRHSTSTPGVRCRRRRARSRRRASPDGKRVQKASR